MQLSSISLAITRLGAMPWTPATLFAAGEQGAWYDLSDMSTMFQDSAGTTPVTAVEQPVGLVLDKSKGLVLGPELVVNGGFDSDAAWTLGAGWTIGSAAANANVSAYANINQNVAVVPGKTYCVTFTVSAFTSGVLQMFLGNGGSGAPNLESILSAGTYSATGVFPTGHSANIQFRGGPAFNGTIDNISVKEILGNHASQATSAARPVLSSRVNLLTKTEDFSDAVWTKIFSGTGAIPVVTPGFPDPDGGTTAFRVQLNCGAGATGGDYSVIRQAGLPTTAGTRSLYVKSNTGSSQTFQLANTSAVNSPLVTATTTFSRVAAQTNDYTVFDIATSGDTGATRQLDLIVWHPQLETGTTATRYQRVNTSTDYDTTGFKHYLKFDGVDDALATASIDFTATDKMTVVAGVRKLSNAGVNILCELSPNSDGTMGTFNLAAPVNDKQYYFQLNAESRIDGTVLAGYSSPVTNVVSIGFDISQTTSETEITARINGVNKTLTFNSSTGSGTGNFGNYPLYIGSRAGTSLPFNGHLYGLIIRGAQSTDAQIAAAEAYVNSKTGAY